MLDRFEIKNEDIVTDFIKKGIPVILVAGHQGNWEWGIHRLALSKNPHDVIYQKLNNPTFNEFTKQVRSRFGHVVLLEKRESVLLTRERKDIPRVICLASDQAPQKPESAYWTTFLHQETAFFTGMERFARDYQYPVVFAEVIRKKRGNYTMTYELLANVPFDDLAPGEIIERFARRLEKSINANSFIDALLKVSVAIVYLDLSYISYIREDIDLFEYGMFGDNDNKVDMLLKFCSCEFSSKT
jgi:KDO2-lipid IV(A) lauroyltransferase